MDLVTVIVPIYNSAKFLDKCITSIRNQTYTCLDIILVNDGSVDESMIICKKHELLDKRIRVIDKKNSGVSSTRNMGLDRAKGKFILFVDSDDFIEFNMVEKMIDNITKHDSDIAICALKKINRNKVKIYELGFCGKLLIKDFVNKYIKIICDIIIGSPCNKLYKSEIIQRYNIRFEVNNEYAEDLIFNYNYLKHCKVISILDEILYNYVLSSNNSLSSKFRLNCYENAEYVYDTTVDFLNYFSINPSAVKEKFANIFVRLVHHIYQKKSTLSHWQREKLIKEKFSSEKIKKLINGSNIHRKIDVVVLYLVRKEYFTLLSCFFVIKNEIKSYKQTIENLLGR